MKIYVVISCWWDFLSHFCAGVPFGCYAWQYSKAIICSFFGTRDSFWRRQFFHGQGWGCLGMTQTHYIYCALDFYYYLISSTSDHQAVDSRGWGLPAISEEVKWLSSIWLFATPWTVAYQAPSSMKISKQEYWSSFPFLSPGNLPNPEIKPRSPTLQADALLSEPPGKPKICFILFNRKLISKTLLQGDNHMGIK